jgi:hypothetical protein
MRFFLVVVLSVGFSASALQVDPCKEKVIASAGWTKKKHNQKFITCLYNDKQPVAFFDLDICNAEHSDVRPELKAYFELRTEFQKYMTADGTINSPKWNELNSMIEIETERQPLAKHIDLGLPLMELYCLGY